MSNNVREAILEATRVLKDLDKVQAPVIVRNGDNFSFAIPGEPKPTPAPTTRPSTKTQR